MVECKESCGTAATGSYPYYSISSALKFQVICPQNGTAVLKGLTRLGLQSRFGDDWGQITWSLNALSPKRDCGSEGVFKNVGITKRIVVLVNISGSRKDIRGQLLIPGM